MDELGSLKRKKSGQTKCECGKMFNNAKVPESCDICEFRLDGSYEPPPEKKKVPDSVLISENIVSFRKETAGEPVRVFVDFDQNKVSEFKTYVRFRWPFTIRVSGNQKSSKNYFRLKMDVQD